MATIRTIYYIYECAKCPIRVISRMGRMDPCKGTEIRGLDKEIPIVKCNECNGRGFFLREPTTGVFRKLLDQFSDLPSQYTCAICSGKGGRPAFLASENPELIAAGWIYVDVQINEHGVNRSHWVRTHHEPGIYPMVSTGIDVVERETN